MPRRPPPTPLRLVTGPLPSRRQPKHTLPSLPRPAFHLPIVVLQGPTPRPRAKSISLQDEPVLAISLTLPDPQVPSVIIPERWSMSSGRRSSDSGSSSPVSVSSRGTDSGPPSPMGVRGPWDHSSSIKIPFDVSAVLPPPKPAALI